MTSLLHRALARAWSALTARLRVPARPGRLRVCIDDLPNPIFIKDRLGRYVAVNRALEEVMGRSSAQILGRHTSAFASPVEAERHRSTDQAVLDSGGVLEYESTVQRGDGSVRIFLFNKRAFPSTGPVTGTIGSFIDISQQKDVEQRLARSEAAYRNIVEAANEGIWSIDRTGNTTYVNTRMAAMLGYEVDEFNGRSMYDFMDAEARVEAEGHLQRRSQGNDDVHDFRFRHKDGSARWCIIGTKVLWSASGEFDGALGMLTDITARKQAEDEVAAARRELEARVAARTLELQESNRALQQRQRAIDASSHTVVIVRLGPGSSQVEYANPAFERLTGVACAQAIGQPWTAVLRWDTSVPEGRRLAEALREGRDDDAIVQLIHPDGRQSWCHLYLSVLNEDAGTASGADRTVVIAAHDITSIREYEERLERLTKFDTLTGLPNAGMLEIAIQEAIVHRQAGGGAVHVVLLGLDRFRIVTQSLGKERGDALLLATGLRLQAVCTAADCLARLGGDQFGLVLSPARGTEAGLDAFVAKLQAVVAQPLDADSHMVRLSASIGIASFGGADDATALLPRAQIAMTHAKLAGRGGVARYHPSMGDEVVARMAIEVALANAVIERRFHLYYQPKIDIATGRTVGFEALLRWRSEALGDVSPTRFIPLLEETGDILAVGNDVLKTACAQARRWNILADAPVQMSVNLSARQFNDPALVDRVEGALQESGLAAAHLTLEITESALVEDIEKAILKMQALRALGVGLSIDDFGTGYSSLAYLKRFPLTELKIDQSFVRDVLVNVEGALIVSSIINLARDMHFHVVAEGVETAGQLAFLQERGCQTVQGYLFSKPLDPAQVRLPGLARALADAAPAPAAVQV